jgi:hypothetical protein
METVRGEHRKNQSSDLNPCRDSNQGRCKLGLPFERELTLGRPPRVEMAEDT